MGKKGNILIVDDEENIVSSLRGILSDEGYAVSTACDGKGAIEEMGSRDIDVVILDIWIPGMDGLQILKKIKEISNDTEIIMISGHGSIDTAVKATKLGAFEFLEKPLSLDTVLITVANAISSKTSKEDRLGNTIESVTPPKVDMKASQAGRLPSSVKKEGGNRCHRQRTLKTSVVLCGQGLHSGIKTGLILSPLPINSGIIFENISTGGRVQAHISNVRSTAFATSLKKDMCEVKTIEHIMAVLHMYRLNNLLIKVGDEVPIMDGSAKDFCHMIDDGGIEEQEGFFEEIIIEEPISVTNKNREYITVEPYDGFCIDYTIDYPLPIGRQNYLFNYDGETIFKDEIASARTFGFLKDYEKLEEMGLASGGRLSNVILLDNERVINTSLRFENEFARHKILDIIGDLYLLGRPIRGKVSAHMTGHAENIALVRKIDAVYGG